MAEEIKITFTGGGRLGDEMALPFADGASVLVGRSHSTAVRVTEPDVSGRHLELLRQAGGVWVRNLSRFPAQINGEAFQTDEVRPLAVGDVLQIGARVRIRVDDLPGHVAAGDDAATGETYAPEAVTGETCAPEFLAAAVAEAGVPAPAADEPTGRGASFNVPESIDSAPFATLEESSTAGFVPPPVSEPPPASEPPPSESEPAPSASEPALDDAPTADESPVPLPPSPPPPPPPEAEPTSLLFDSADDDATLDGEDVTTGGGDGETMEMQTRAGSMDEIFAMKRELENKRRTRKTLIGMAVFLLLAVIGAVFFLTRVVEEDGLAYPTDRQGRPDRAYYVIRGAGGSPLVKVDYPNDPRMVVKESAVSNGVEVMTLMGRRRDVPFMLKLDRLSDPEEIKIDLLVSARRWMNAETARGEMIFEEKGPLAVKFFEIDYPGSLESAVSWGTPFVAADYVATRNGKQWKGVLFYFRFGIDVYVLRREIPDRFWARGGYRLRSDTNLAVYSRFSEYRWESRGTFEAAEISDAALVKNVEQELAVGARSSQWAKAERWIDTLLARHWRDGSDTEQRALGFLDAFRAKKRKFYDQFVLDYMKWTSVGDARRAQETADLCRAVFGTDDNRFDLRCAKVRDPKTWQNQTR